MQHGAARMTAHLSEALAPGEEYHPMHALFEAAKVLTGAADPISSMPSVLQMLASFMGLQHGAVALLQDGGLVRPGAPDSRTISPYVIAATAKGPVTRPSSCRAIPAAAVRHVLHTGMALVSRDLVAELGQDALPPEARSDRLALIAVPIRYGAHSPFVLGALCAYRALTGGAVRHLDTDLRVLTMIASVLEQAILFRLDVVRDRDRILQEARAAIHAAADVAGPTAATATPIAGIIGSSPAIKAVIAQIRKVAPTQAPVLLRGESGTGKEMFASALHGLSTRADRPFVKLNCAALSASLLESELFGHEKGAFTGALAMKKGRFELADGGTLFLDEIGEIGPEFQAKLLRILQEGEFERVGGSRTLRVDVRLITATNRDLEAAVANGSFRADLYFRICVVPIALPPLRERRSDIDMLARGFLERFNKRNGMDKRLSKEALAGLRACNFPGNVRELENCISRLATLSPDTVIRADDLACHTNQCLSADLWRLQSGARSPIGGLATGSVVLPVLARRPEPEAAAPRPQTGDDDTDRAALVDAMERAGWVQAKAARLLGMTPRQIGYALKKHAVEITRF